MLRLWKKLKVPVQLAIVSVVLFIIALPITIPAGKTLHYILTHGEEIENFQPYTVEQAKKDELRILGYNIK